MNKKRVAIAMAVMSSLVMTGCANSHSNDTYASNRTGIVQNVSYGVVTNVRYVTIQDDNQIPVGAVAGAVVGGILGHKVGGGTGKQLATIGGVVAGGLAGNALQTQTNKTKGAEVEVRLDNGQMIAVTQQVSNEFQTGTRVRVVDAGGRITLSSVSSTMSGYAR